MSQNLRSPVAPNIPLAPIEYQQGYHDQTANVLRLYFNQLNNLTQQLTGPTGGGYLKFPNGSFYNTVRQTTLGNVEEKISFTGTSASNGVSIDPTNNTRIVVTVPGYYNFQFSLQLLKTGGGNVDFFIWPKVNGAGVDNSNSKESLNGGANEAKIAAWNFVLPMNKDDYFELAWSASNNTAVIEAFSAPVLPPSPAVPPALLTATFVSALYP